MSKPLWKDWVKVRNKRLDQLKARAKGKADLKPRHLKKATEIYKEEFYQSLPSVGLNDVFSVEYGESLSHFYNAECALLKLVRRDNMFTGKPIEIKLGNK